MNCVVQHKNLDFFSFFLHFCFVLFLFVLLFSSVFFSLSPFVFFFLLFFVFVFVFLLVFFESELADRLEPKDKMTFNITTTFRLMR